MQVTIKKWGNSPAVRIPAHVMQAVHFEVDQMVEVHEENGRVIIEPVKQEEYTLEVLLAGITEENLHHEVSIGPAKGKEIW